jgi:PAS domain S-box-containing protein
MQLQILDAISRAQASFIAEADIRSVFNDLLGDLLKITASEYGFIGEVLHSAAGAPYLKTHAITNIAWDDATRDFYTEHAPKGMAFYNLKSLFGHVLLTAEPLISNDPYHDPRRGGLPPGHPPLNAFLGIPIVIQNELIAMVGLSNRSGGYDQQLLSELQPLIATIGQLVRARRSELARQRADAALRESEKRFQELALHGRIVTWEIDNQGLYTHVSEVAKSVWGYEPSQLMGNFHFYDIHPADDRERFIESAFAIMQRQERIRSLENPIMRPDGSIIWVETHGIPIFNAEGEPVGYRGADIDITQRKLKDAELTRLSLVASQTTNGVVITDQWGVITWVNEGFTRISGYPLAQIIGKKPGEFLQGEESDRTTIATMAYAIAHHQPFQVEIINYHRLGHRYWIDISCNPILNNQGRCEGYVAIQTDITQRKQAEAILAESAHQTQTILDNVLDGILTFDEQGEIATANRAAEAIFGLSAIDLIGQSIDRLFDTPWREQKWSQCADQTEEKIYETVGVRNGGDRFAMELSLSRISHRGNPLLIALVRDITERQRIDRMKSEFVSTVSHELRTPLTSIAGALGLLAGGLLGTLEPQAQAMVDIAQKNSLRLTHLINDLLDIEKITAGKLHFDFQQQPILPLIEQAIEATQTYALQYGITYRLTTPPSANYEVLVDGQRLIQVITNFLSNAAKFSPSGGEVTLWISQPRHNWLRISVHDNGTGIPEEFRNRIFQKFSQADSSDSRRQGGTGLGLAISRELIVRMSGNVGFDSAPGKGTTFYFELPLAKPVTTPIVQGSENSTPTLLVVEDDEDIATLLATLLEHAGYHCQIARNGKDALAKLAQENYAAITLDLGLPDMNGLTLIHHLRQKRATENLPIIVVSARIERGQLALTSHLGGIDWLAKPIDHAALINAVRRAVLATPVSPIRLLHVEDDSDLHRVVAAIAGNGYVVDQASNLHEARSLLQTGEYNAIILDRILPDGDGWALLPLIRAIQPSPPVVILSGNEASAEEIDAVEAFLLKSRVTANDLIRTLNYVINLEKQHEKS